MKLLSLILSVIILSLALMPCVDAQVSIDTEKTECEHEHSGDNHDHEDDCTPFCSCDCCGVSVVAPVLFWFETQEFDSNFNFSFYYSFQYSFDYTDGVWYPPTLS